MLHWHATWSVNSFGHLFGTRPLDSKGKPYTSDGSRNCFWIALFTIIGEWLHYYHHAKADSAYFGWGPWDIDIGKWVLMLFEKMGLVRNVKKPPPAFAR
mgnify:FL=1